MEDWNNLKSEATDNSILVCPEPVAYKLDSDLWYKVSTDTWSASDPADGSIKYNAGTFVRNDGTVFKSAPDENFTTFNANDFTTVDLATNGNGVFTGTGTDYTAYASGSFVAGEPVGNGDLENQNRTAVGKGYFVTVDPKASGSNEDADATAYTSGATVTTQQDLIAFATDDGGVKITSVSAAKDALTKIMDALGQLHLDRASLGAIQSRIDYTSQQLTTSKQNLSQARSRITDVDIAEETTEFARQQILVQAGTQMLREANNLPRTALELLR